MLQPFVHSLTELGRKYVDVETERDALRSKYHNSFPFISSDPKILTDDCLSCAEVIVVLARSKEERATQ